ncbi:hypothetical protein pv_179 [Pithovirus sibericum]|uniref:Uncharacterized protein n=1 Tax=Pithovirus sibericum TaxID=1450746 RepID=W5S4V1_9VIRU|nr:hypothetical protein pv_179 [Pithovirus sibericum]AHH01746.1 hypothetical protein pv_179 [Pithovirus sibericum]
MSDRLIVPGSLLARHEKENKTVTIAMTEAEFKMLATAIKYYKSHIEANRRHYAKRKGVEVTEVRERVHDFYKLLDFADQIKNKE